MDECPDTCKVRRSRGFELLMVKARLDEADNGQVHIEVSQDPWIMSPLSWLLFTIQMLMIIYPLTALISCKKEQEDDGDDEFGKDKD